MSDANDQNAVMERLGDAWWRLRNLFHIKSEDTGQIVPFNPYPEQEAVFDAVINQGHQRIIIPKARRRGMSTGIGVLMLDRALTNPGYEAGIVDRNQAEASKKLANIIKTSLEKLPAFLRDDLRVDKDNEDLLKFHAGKDTPSAIYAGTGYRGGNCNFLHVSEWGWIQCMDPRRSEEIQTGAIQAARKGTILVETTWKGGKQGHLWKYTEEALNTLDEHKHPRSWRVMFFPWHTDPTYQVQSTNPIRREVMDYFMELAARSGIVVSEAQMRWYQEEAWPLGNNRYGEYPSTLDECFLSPMEGVIYEAEMARALAERRITSIPVEQGLPVYVAMDIGKDDSWPLAFIQPVGKEIRLLNYYVSHRELFSHYGTVIKKWMVENRVDDIRLLLPHDGNRQSLETGRALADCFREMGFRNVQVVPKIPATWTGINYVRDVFPYLWFDKNAIERKSTRGNKAFPSFRECMDNYHQAEQQNGAMRSMEPVHDDYSHGADALRTFCEAWQRGMINRSLGKALANDGIFDHEESSGTKLAGGSRFRPRR